MVRRSGSADLPLHSGHVPPWLAQRMASLGAVICQAIVHHYGRDEFLKRVGARTVQSLAMVAEVVHGAPYRFADPARFSLAHGGKDRHPYPVPIKVYDETLRVMKSAIHKAKLGREEELQALQRLDRQARQLERTATGPSFNAFVARERQASPALDGRSVFGWERDIAQEDETKSR